MKIFKQKRKKQKRLQKIVILNLAQFGIDNIKHFFNDIANHYINYKFFEDQMKKAKMSHGQKGKIKCSMQ